MDGALDTLDLTTLQLRRTEALEAVHQLSTGAKEVAVAHAGRSLTFAAAQLPELRRYVLDLQAAIDRKTGTGLGRRPIHPVAF